jgi:hypothetical protein
VLEIAQPAVDQLGRGGRGTGGKIVLLDKQYTQPAAGGVAGDAGAIDAPADNGEIEIDHASLVPFSARQGWRAAAAGSSLIAAGSALASRAA